ncbi:hypothetical protein AGR7C_Cc160321 [Agrobacterium deltaense Zutra 3/1]|uniref:Uncharacterized protein n=1 Tax=Agrobacterium deltaense Zutra 3/1 TaxID=1183427 RepID=A0A1S7PRE8_9HYPH|nr:hypothetical protein AGR7C_Cc160321 [Agrobacterium deltaense Zutra 3/1]
MSKRFQAVIQCLPYLSSSAGRERVMTGNREVAFGPLSRIYAEDLKTSWPSITFLLLTILLGSVLATAGPYVFSRLIDDLPDAPLQWMLGFFALCRPDGAGDGYSALHAIYVGHPFGAAGICRDHALLRAHRP